MYHQVFLYFVKDLVVGYEIELKYTVAYMLCVAYGGIGFKPAILLYSLSSLELVWVCANSSKASLGYSSQNP